MNTAIAEPRVLIDAYETATRAAKRIAYRDATAALKCQCLGCRQRVTATEAWLVGLGLLPQRQEGD